MMRNSSIPDGERSAHHFPQALTLGGQSRFWLLFGSIWLLVGVPFLLLAMYVLRQEHQLSTSGRLTDATVLTKKVSRSGDTIHHSIGYRFTTPEGRTIYGESGVPAGIRDSIVERGSISVEYLPNRPSVNRIVGSSQRTLLLVFSGVGLLLSAAGATIVAVTLRSARRRTRLLTVGVRTSATVAEVTPMNLRVNGRRQWRIRYQYRDYQSQPHERSMSLDADEAQRWNTGDIGDVLFDPDHPARSVWLGRSGEDGR